MKRRRPKDPAERARLCVHRARRGRTFVSEVKRRCKERAFGAVDVGSWGPWEHDTFNACPSERADVIELLSAYARHISEIFQNASRNPRGWVPSLPRLGDFAVRWRATSA
jgi:hypothetical protein